MKTNEFIEKVEELGYLVIHDRICHAIRIYKKDEIYCWLHISTVNNVNDNLYSFQKAKFEDEILKLVKQYTNTPIEEREEVYYYIELPLITEELFGGDLAPLYLTYHVDEDRWTAEGELGEKRTKSVKQMFLKDEIPSEYEWLAKRIK